MHLILGYYSERHRKIGIARYLAIKHFKQPCIGIHRNDKMMDLSIAIHFLL